MGLQRYLIVQQSSIYQLMKKDQARSLEDEFSSLFRPQNHQASLSENSETYLLDSQQPSQQFNSVTFKQVAQTQSQSEQQDFLDKVDDILCHGEENEAQLTRREIMLNFKVNELKLMCKNLKLANTKLAQRIEELERPRSEITQNTVELNRSQDLTMMQQQFTEIEQELTRYKQQLSRYQQQTASQLGIKNQEMNRIRNELNELKSVNESLDKELREKNKVINLLEQRNEELLLAIEQLQTSQQQQTIKESRGHTHQSHFNQKISMEMEEMIDKLLKELKYERRNTTKNINEIKRLNSEIINLQNKIKDKNSKVYELQLTMIKMNKQQFQNPAKERSPQKYDYENKDENEVGYTPYRNRNAIGGTFEGSNKNRTQANMKNFNKNRVSAQRQGAVSGKTGSNYAPLLPLSKVFSTFTLMDLLNRQFKIRTSEKYIIASKIVQLYASKFQRGDFDNLISEEIQIHNFSSQSPSQLKVRINALNRSELYEPNEESMLYNMAFILDTLLNQVDVIDSYLGTILELNIPDYIELVLNKQTKQEKQKLLLELSSSIMRQYQTN